MALRCYGYPESELCDSLIELAPNGEITQVLPLLESRYPRFDVTRRAFLEDADDRFWRRIGSQLCKRHPGAAPSEALRRFARSQGRNKVEWLTTLVHCFEQPPPEAYAYALAIDGRDDPYAAAVEKAFRAWGYPRTALDALWQQATGSEPEPTAGENLLRVFDQVAEDFDDRLRHGAEAERGIVRQLLFETVDGAEAFFWVDAVADDRSTVFQKALSSSTPSLSTRSPPKASFF